MGEAYLGEVLASLLRQLRIHCLIELVMYCADPCKANTSSPHSHNSLSCRLMQGAKRLNFLRLFDCLSASRLGDSSTRVPHFCNSRLRNPLRKHWNLRCECHVFPRCLVIHRGAPSSIAAGGRGKLRHRAERGNENCNKISKCNAHALPSGSERIALRLEPADEPRRLCDLPLGRSARDNLGQNVTPAVRLSRAYIISAF